RFRAGGCGLRSGGGKVLSLELSASLHTVRKPQVVLDQILRDALGLSSAKNSKLLWWYPRKRVGRISVSVLSNPVESDRAQSVSDSRTRTNGRSDSGGSGTAGGL